MKLLARTSGDPVYVIEPSDVGEVIDMITITWGHVGMYCASDETWSDLINCGGNTFFYSLEDVDLAVELYAYYLSHDSFLTADYTDSVHGILPTFTDSDKMMCAARLHPKLQRCSLIVDGVPHEVFLDPPLWYFTGVIRDDARYLSFLKPDRAEGRMEYFFEAMWNS